MGYCYSKGQLVCDRCSTPGATKRPCPWRHCPALALCSKCFAETPAERAEHHKNCKAGHLKYEAERAEEKELLSVGHFLRCSGVGIDDDRVKATFRNGKDEETEIICSKAVYHLFPPGEIATLKQFEAAILAEANKAAEVEKAELRADLGVTQESVSAYDPEASVYKIGRHWGYTTLGGGSAGTYDTKREATEAAHSHKKLKQEQFDNPSGFRDIVSVRARKSLALIKKYQDQGFTELEAAAKAREEQRATLAAVAEYNAGLVEVLGPENGLTPAEEDKVAAWSAQKIEAGAVLHVSSEIAEAFNLQPVPGLIEIHDESNPIETFSQELAEAAEELKEESLNEAAGRQGMMGPKKAAGNLDGSPLFGSAQLTLF